MIRGMLTGVLVALFVLAPSAAMSGAFYQPATAAGVAAADSDTYGVAIDWTSTTTIEVQPGQRIADDGTVFTVGSAFSVTFADIDTGAEANAGYYVWLTGASSAVLSLSATSPTGVSGGKYLAGWIYNDSGSNIVPFRTEVLGEALEVTWSDIYSNHSIVAATHTLATTLTEVDTSSTGDAPAARVLGLTISWSSSDSFTLFLGVDGTTDIALLTGPAANNVDSVIYTPTQGPSIWWRKSGSGTGDVVNAWAMGFRFDRSGV